MSAFPIFAVGDVDAAATFYERAFDFVRAYRWPPDGEPEFAFLTRNEDGLGLVRDEPGKFSLCIYVEDVDAKAAELRALAAQEVEPPTDQPWGERVAQFDNPHGHRLVIITPLSRD